MGRWQSSVRVPCHLVEMSCLSVICMVTHGFQLCLHVPQVGQAKVAIFIDKGKGSMLFPVENIESGTISCVVKVLPRTLVFE